MSPPARGYRKTAPAALRAWLATPPGVVAGLILATMLVRLAIGWALGLGIDESYMVAAGRELHLGYFDHPPLAWWLAWAAARLFHSEAGLVVRLPFIGLFAASTWLLYRLTARLYTPRAGVWAAVTMNMAPVLGVTTAGWVLPDGPLVCALLGAALCLAHALPLGPPASGRPHAWRWWLGAGGCAGLALLAKYSALLTLAGALLYLLTQREHRRWLARPHPYAAALLAGLIFAPVLAWNARHGWASFAFQGARSVAGPLHPLAPFMVLAGEAVFLLPWIWLPLMAAYAAALRRGPADARGWLLCCLAVFPIVGFALIALWARGRVLFHWAAPGYLFLFPLLGVAVARRVASGSRVVRAWLLGSAAVVGTGLLLVGSEVSLNWLPGVAENFALGTDPDLAAVNWTSLRADLDARGLLGRPGLVVAALRWHDAGKVDYALGGAAKVICLGDDPREYGYKYGGADFAGDDVLVVAPRSDAAAFLKDFGPSFDRIETLRPVMLRHAGRPAMRIPLFLGYRLHAGAMPRSRR